MPHEKKGRHKTNCSRDRLKLLRLASEVYALYEMEYDIILGCRKPVTAVVAAIYVQWCCRLAITVNSFVKHSWLSKLRAINCKYAQYGAEDVSENETKLIM